MVTSGGVFYGPVDRRKRGGRQSGAKTAMMSPKIPKSKKSTLSRLLHTRLGSMGCGSGAAVSSRAMAYLLSWRSVQRATVYWRILVCPSSPTGTVSSSGMPGSIG